MCHRQRQRVVRRIETIDALAGERADPGSRQPGHRRAAVDQGHRVARPQRHRAQCLVLRQRQRRQRVVRRIETVDAFGGQRRDARPLVGAANGRAGVAQRYRVFRRQDYSAQRLVLRHAQRQHIVRRIEPVDALAGERRRCSTSVSAGQCCVACRLALPCLPGVSATVPSALYCATVSDSVSSVASRRSMPLESQERRSAAAVSPASATPPVPQGHEGPRRVSCTRTQRLVLRHRSATACRPSHRDNRRPCRRAPQLGGRRCRQCRATVDQRHRVGSGVNATVPSAPGIAPRVGDSTLFVDPDAIDALSTPAPADARRPSARPVPRHVSASITVSSGVSTTVPSALYCATAQRQRVVRRVRAGRRPCRRVPRSARPSVRASTAPLSLRVTDGPRWRQHCPGDAAPPSATACCPSHPAGRNHW